MTCFPSAHFYDARTSRKDSPVFEAATAVVSVAGIPPKKPCKPATLPGSKTFPDVPAIQVRMSKECAHGRSPVRSPYPRICHPELAPIRAQASAGRRWTRGDCRSHIARCRSGSPWIQRTAPAGPLHWTGVRGPAMPTPQRLPTLSVHRPASQNLQYVRSRPGHLLFLSIGLFRLLRDGR